MLLTKVILLLLPIGLAAQSGPTVPSASLSIQPNHRGDAAVFLVTRNLPGGIDEARIESSLCNWEETNGGDTYVAGLCRGMLHAKGRQFDQWLNLAPVVVTLHQAGIQDVVLKIDLYFWSDQRLETPQGWTEEESTGIHRYRFHSASVADLPMPIRILLTNPRRAPRPLLALSIVFALPGLLALVLRLYLKKASAAGATPQIKGWLTWIPALTWVCWLTAIPPGSISDLFSDLISRHLYLGLTAAAAVFCLPPLFASALAASIARPRKKEDSEGSSRFGMQILQLALELPLMILAAFVVQGLSMLEDHSADATIAGCVLGIGIALTASWFVKQSGVRGWTLLDTEEFRARALEIARRTGVRLNGVMVFRHKHFRQANAFAYRQGRHIVFSDRLLESLSKREVDTVVAHELSHLNDGPLQFPPKVYWAYLPVYVASSTVLVSQGVMHAGEPFLALVALAATLFAAAVSRKREYRADAWSARVMGDPHGLIAALSHLHKLAEEPVSGGRIDGAILTHPSLTQRALALAARFRFPSERAMALVNDPGLLERGSPAAETRYSIGSKQPFGEPLFSQTAKAAHLIRSSWLFPALLVAQVVALFCIATVWDAGWLAKSVFLLCGAPCSLWCAFHVASWWHTRFLNQMAERISANLPTGSQGDFAGLWPGSAITPVQGFFAWDLGRVALSGDRLIFTGERARFSLLRTAIVSIEAVAGPPSWIRKHGILVRWPGGSFALQMVNGASRRDAAKLLQEWNTWWMAGWDTPPGAESLSGDNLLRLPALPPRPPTGTPAIAAILPYLILIFGATFGFCSLSGTGAPAVLAGATAVVLYLIVLWPALIVARNRKPPDPLSYALRAPNFPDTDSLPEPDSLSLSDRLQYEEQMVRAASLLLGQASQAPTPQEADRLLVQVCEKCQKVLKVSPRHFLALRIWGNAIFGNAPRHSLEEAQRLFTEAGEKFSQSLAVAPQDPDVMADLAFSMLRRAELDRGESAAGLLSGARELCERSFQTRPDSEFARILWARALARQAEPARKGDMDGVLIEASAYFRERAATVGVTSSNLRGLGLILLAQGMRATGETSLRYLREAKQKFIESEGRDPGTGAYRAACVCARLGQPEECKQWLEQSREPGVFIAREEMAAEPHFASVRECEWFQSLVAVREEDRSLTVAAR